MAVLKALEVKVLESTKIQARFNLELDPFINTSNISVKSNVSTIPDPQVLEVKIVKDKLTIRTQPLFPYVQYFITFKSSDLLLFKS